MPTLHTPKLEAELAAIFMMPVVHLWGLPYEVLMCCSQEHTDSTTITHVSWGE